MYTSVKMVNECASIHTRQYYVLQCYAMDVILTVDNQDRTRNNGFKLKKFRFRRKIRRNCFSNRVVDEWNGLSNHIVSVHTMGSFKRLDKFIDEDDRWN